MEEHALVDGRTKWDRTSGLHGQLHPSGLGARVQYEATSRWVILPEGKSRRNSQWDYNNQDMDKHVNGSTKTQASSLAPLMAPLSSVSYHGAGEVSLLQEKSTLPTPQKPRQQTATDQRKTSSEWLSVETTSTMCRQSVKDLYYYYGIQRPVGLVLSENVAFNPELTPRPVLKYIYCRVCSLPSSLDALKRKCGHSLCGSRECPSPEAITTRDGSAECTDKCEGIPLQEDKARVQSPDCEVPRQAHLEQQTVRPKPKELHQRETSKKYKSRSKEPLDNLPVIFPVLRIEEAIPSHGSRGTGPKHAEFPDYSSVFQQTTIASETLTTVRGPPFPMDDALSATYPSSTTPIALQVSQVASQDHDGHHHRSKGRHNRSSHSSSSHNLERRCDSDSSGSSGCYTTHQGYRPYRHSIHARGRGADILRRQIADT